MPSGRTNNLHESGRGLGHVTPTIFGSTVGYPSWICDDVIMLHPVTAFHGPNIVLNFHVDWFGSCRTSDWRQTDRRTDRHLTSSLLNVRLLRGAMA